MNEIENVRTKEYIEWLCKFSDIYPYFDNIEFSSLDDSVISREEKDNLYKVYQLYYIVENYAKTNDIFTKDKIMEVMYQGVGFRLSRRPVNPKNILVSRTDPSCLSFPIDYEEIISLENKKKREDILLSISTSISKLIELGVSEEEIRTLIDDTFARLNEKEKVKTLTKKD